MSDKDNVLSVAFLQHYTVFKGLALSYPDLRKRTLGLEIDNFNQCLSFTQFHAYYYYYYRYYYRIVNRC